VANIRRKVKTRISARVKRESNQTRQHPISRPRLVVAIHELDGEKMGELPEK